MSDSKPLDVCEEELANAPVDQDRDESDSVQHAMVPADELGEQNPAVQSEVQQAGAEGDADVDLKEVAEGSLVEQIGELQQEAEDQRAEGSLQDASVLQQDALSDSSLQDGAEAEAAEHGPASIGHVVEAEQGGEPAETPGVGTAFQLDNATGASSIHRTAAEQFSGAAGGSYSAHEQLVPGALDSALANPELDPDHPLLARAQKALSKQLLAIKDRLEAEVREKAIALQVCQPPFGLACFEPAQEEKLCGWQKPFSYVA